MPRRRTVRVDAVDRVAEELVALDWRVQDVTVAVMRELPSPEAEQAR